MRIRNWFIFALSSTIAATALAAWLYNGTLVSSAALAYNSSYTLDLQTAVRGGITQASAQAIYSSTTIPAVSFTDGGVSTGSITVAANTGLLAAPATNQITLAATSVLLAASATNYLTVLSTNSLTSAKINLNGKTLNQGTHWTTGATTDLTAASITTAVNAVYGFSATRVNSVVSVSATPGANGNSATFSSNTSSITVGGALFGAGHNSRIASAEIVVRGQRIRQGREFQSADTSSGTATNMAVALSRLTGIQASASGLVIYATATPSGIAGNAFTMTSNAASYLTVAGATFSGGRDAAYVRINGVTVTFTPGATAALSAKALSDAIMAKASLNTVISSTWNASAVVTATSTLTGTARNYALVTNAPANLTLSGAAMTGGTAPAYTLGGTAITLPAHGLTTGLGVTYTRASSDITGLTNSTLYYAARLDANTLALATSEANAVAGTYITLGSSTTTGPHSFTLTPEAYAGNAGLVWYGSNDGTNYSALAVSSVTYSSPSATPVSTLWDFGRSNYRFLRLTVTAPTTGGLALVVTVHGSD